MALVTLRDLRSEDWWQIARWEEDEEILRFLGKKRLTVSPWGASEVPPAERGSALDRRRALAIETALGVFIGYVELRDINWRQRAAELRICIGEKSCWGRGLGTEALRVFLSLSFQRFKLDYIYLRVYCDNPRAIRCYEKCGFTVEGILRAGSRRRELGDVVLMGIRRHQLATAG